MRDWLPEDHLVWLVLEVVDRLDTSVLHVAHPNVGVGRRAYNPDMLLALLVYAYCSGVRSSRAIERLCGVDVAFRVICANDIPDHSTIARFRQGYEQAAQQLFVQVLALCARAGLLKVGVVAVDGTKMAASASRKANRSKEDLEREVAGLFSEAERVDAEEDRLFPDLRGDQLPAELASPSARQARLDAALAELEAEEQARRVEEEQARARLHETTVTGRGMGGRRRVGANDIARAEAALARTLAKATAHRAAVENAAALAGRKPKGPLPGKGPRVARAEARVQKAKQRAAQAAKEGTLTPPWRPPPRVNMTDPDSRLMKSPGGWLQGYNAQMAVDQAGVILAAAASQDHTDNTNASR
jgi:transposase